MKFTQFLLGQDDNDSQQAAEAMIQLGYYSTQQPQDESMDFDPNYDPSDFLMKKEDQNQQQPIQQQQNQQYQENYNYLPAGGIQEGAGGDEIAQDYYSGFGQQAFNVTDYPSYQQQQPQHTQEEYMQQQQQQQAMPSDVLDDLDISDSDDEDQNESNENAADTSKDDDGLWF